MGIDSISNFSFALSQSVRDSLIQVVMKTFVAFQSLVMLFVFFL